MGVGQAERVHLESSSPDFDFYVVPKRSVSHDIALSVSEPQLDEGLDSKSDTLVGEEYAKSTTAIRRLGRAAVSLELDQTRETAVYELAYEDFVTAIEEHLMTDEDYGDRLHSNRPRTHAIKNGQVVAKDDTPMIELGRNGVAAARRAAIKNFKMWGQVKRDVRDLRLASKVDNLAEGEMLAALSMDPKTLLSQDEEFWEGKGYREGMAVLQIYWKQSSDSLKTRTVILKHSDVKRMRQLYFDEFGIEITGDIQDSDWINNYITEHITSESKLEEFTNNFRKKYESLSGVSPTKSITDFLNNEHSQITLRTYFDSYIIAAGLSLERGQKNTEIHDLAQAMLSGAHFLSPDDRRNLIKIINQSVFDANDARFMDSIIRFAAVEQLRRTLPGYLIEKSNISRFDTEEPSQLNDVYVAPAIIAQSLRQEIIHNITVGRQARRTYGGCSSTSAKDFDLDKLEKFGPQDIFGGKDAIEAETTVNKADTDKWGNRNFTCSKGHPNYRKIKNIKENRCKTCGEDISCEDRSGNRQVDKKDDVIAQLRVKKRDKQSNTLTEVNMQEKSVA